MTEHKRFNAYNPLATPKEVIAWLFAPITAFNKLTAQLDEIDEAIRAVQAEQDYWRKVGKIS